MSEKTVQKEPGKKPAPSKKPKPQQEVVVQISLSELHPFPDHPFQVREDASMQETAESVKEYGVLVPALARPREDGGYELIAGHRRKHACELAGLATMPVIVRDIDRDAATIIMVDSNLQRENILPSERAKAYKMKMEAIKRQGARTDLTSPKISAKFRSDDEVGQDAGVSGDTIRNYIALTQLVPELQQMVDEKKIALSPAYQIAALTPKEQGLLLETIDSEQATPSLSQAQRMKKLSQSGELNEDTMLSIIIAVQMMRCLMSRKQKSGCRSRPEFLIPMSVIAVVRRPAQTGFGCPVTKSCAWTAMRRMTDLTFERFSVDHKYDPLQLGQAIKQ